MELNGGNYDEKVKLSQIRKIDKMSSNVAAKLDDYNGDGGGDEEEGVDEPDNNFKMSGSGRKPD